MKKIIVLLFLIVFIQQVQAQNYSYYCSSNIPKKTFSGNLTSLFGINLLSRNIAENELEKAIKKETGANFKINIENFYGVSLLKGDFKSLEASSKKYAHDGLYFTDVNLKTVCPYNAISYEENKLYFRENMVLKYSLKFTQDDLSKTINSKNLDDKVVSLLSKVTKYGAYLPLITKIKPISLPIKIDENNNAKLKIEDIEVIDDNIFLGGHIIIKKNK